MAGFDSFRRCGGRALSLVFLLVIACSPGEEPEVISCVTLFDCPVGWFCENNVCVETPDAIPSDRDQMGEGNWGEGEGVAVLDDVSFPSESAEGEEDVVPDRDIDVDADADISNDFDSDADVDDDIGTEGNSPDDTSDAETDISEEENDLAPQDHDPLVNDDSDFPSDADSVDDTVPVDDAPIPDNDTVTSFCGDGKNVLSDGLVLYLRMDEPPLFSTVYDSSANPVNGKFSRGASLGHAGVRGGALAFNQYSDLHIPHSDKLNLPSTMSVVAWVNLPDNGDANALPYLVVGKGSGRQANYVMWRENDRKLSFVHHTWELNGICCGVKSLGNIDDGTWHHVAGTYDGIVVRLYVDGVLQGTSDPCTMEPVPNSDPVTIGQVSPNVDYIDPYTGTGYIDEVRIYNRALSLEDILLLRDAPHEFCDDGNTNETDGCDTGCQMTSNYICYGSPSTCEIPAPWQCTNSIQICDSQYDYFDSSYYEYYYQSWVGTSLQVRADGISLWTSPSFSTSQWIEYTTGAKCWPTWYNFTFTNGQTVEAAYTAKGSYEPNQCYFQIKDAPNGGGNTITTTTPTGSGQWPASYSYVGTCQQP